MQTVRKTKQSSTANCRQYASTRKVRFDFWSHWAIPVLSGTCPPKSRWWMVYQQVHKSDQMKVQSILACSIKSVRRHSNQFQIQSNMFMSQSPKISLKDRRLRGDMIEVCKIINHKYVYKVAPKLIYNINEVTRGNDFRLSKNRSHYDLRKFSFTNGIVNIWNICLVDSVDLFKSRLDNFWMFQDVKYDYTVNLAGTGDQSEYDIGVRVCQHHWLDLTVPVL